VTFYHDHEQKGGRGQGKQSKHWASNLRVGIPCILYTLTFGDNTMVVALGGWWGLVVAFICDSGDSIAC